MPYAIDDNNRIKLKPYFYALFTAFTVWQMGIVYFSSTTLSLYGNSIPLNQTATLAVMVAGYLVAIAACIAFINKTVLFGKIALIFALLTSVITILPISSKVVEITYYLVMFACVFMIGVTYNVETYLFHNDFEIKYCILGSTIAFFAIALLRGGFFEVSFLAFQIISIVLLLMLIYAYFHLPKRIDVNLVTLKDAKRTNSLPVQLKVSVFFLTLVSTAIYVFGMTVAEAVKYGIGIYHFSGVVGTLLAALAVFKFKMSPFKIFSFCFALSVVGFVFVVLALIYPSFAYPAIVLLGAAGFSANMAGFLTNTVSMYSPTRIIGQSVVAIGLLVAIIQSLLLQALKDNLDVLFTVLAVASVVTLMTFLPLENNLHYLWKKLLKPKEEEAAPAPDAVTEVAPTEDEAADTGVAEPTPFNKLSPREKEIVTYILSGYANAEIANILFLSENTVKSYRKELYAKLGIHSRRELFALVQRDEKNNA